MSTTLTPKQELFAQKYVELLYSSGNDTRNASEAYRAAYAAEKMKAQTVWREAYALLQNPKVSTRIDELKKSHLKRHNVTVDRVLCEYAKLAFLDIRKAFSEDGNLKPIQELDDDTAAAIAGLEVETLYEGRGSDRQAVGRLHKIKLSDKKGALDSLARHLGMFVDRTDTTGAVTVQVVRVPMAPLSDPEDDGDDADD